MSRKTRRNSPMTPWGSMVNALNQIHAKGSDSTGNRGVAEGIVEGLYNGSDSEALRQWIYREARKGFFYRGLVDVVESAIVRYKSTFVSEVHVEDLETGAFDTYSAVKYGLPVAALARFVVVQLQKKGIPSSYLGGNSFSVAGHTCTVESKGGLHNAPVVRCSTSKSLNELSLSSMCPNYLVEVIERHLKWVKPL